MLLACSWLFGLGYFNPVNWVAWFCAIAVAMVAVRGHQGPIPAQRRTRRCVVAPASGDLVRSAALSKPCPLLLCSPDCRLVACRFDWPVLRSSRAEPCWQACILLPQALVLWIYQSVTARSHELPGWLAQMMRGLLSVTGADVAVDNAAFVVRNADTTVRIGATWELLIDPATLCMLVGGWAMWCYQTARSGSRDMMNVTREPSNATSRLSAVWDRFGSWSRGVAGIARSSAGGLAGRTLCVFFGWAVVRLALLVVVVLNQQLAPTRMASTTWAKSWSARGSRWPLVLPWPFCWDGLCHGGGRTRFVRPRRRVARYEGQSLCLRFCCLLGR